MILADRWFRAWGMAALVALAATVSMLLAGAEGWRVPFVAAHLAALLALLPDVLHGTVGFQQFGYRFSLDAQPFLVALAVAGDARTREGWRSRPSILFIVATVLSVAINLYATIAITRFGYWQ